MAKLLKSSAQKPRHGKGSHTNNAPAQSPVRLSPAEIRMQNNPAAAVKHPSHMVAAVTAKPETRVNERMTPPKSPRKRHTADEYQVDIARASSQRLPTPPQSPVLYYSRTNPVQKTNAGHSHHRHRASAQADFMVARELVSARPNSVNSSRSSAPYGAPAFYRGHEITRNGSISLYNRPQPQIVGNVLSNFSRPRNGHSPPGSVRRQTSLIESERKPSLTDTTPDLSAVSSMHSMRPHVVRSESLTSLDSRASRRFTILHEDSMPLPVVPPSAPTNVTEDPIIEKKEESKRELGIRPKRNPVVETKKEPAVETEKTPKSVKRKSTLSAVLDPSRVFKYNSKQKRHTIAATSAPVLETTEAQRRESGPEGETAREVILPQARRASTIGFEAQSIVNPVSQAPTGDSKDQGKGKIQDIIGDGTGVPVCACCGKVRKPRSSPLDTPRSASANGTHGADTHTSAHGSAGSITTNSWNGGVVQSPVSIRAESPALSRTSERRRSSHIALRTGDPASVLPAAGPKRHSKQQMVKFKFPDDEVIPEEGPRVTRFPSLLGNTHRPEVEALRRNESPVETSNVEPSIEAAPPTPPHSQTSEPAPASVLTPTTVEAPLSHQVDSPPSRKAQAATSIYTQVTLPSPQRTAANVPTRPLSFDSRRESILFNNGEDNMIVPSEPPSPLNPPKPALQPVAALSLPEPELGVRFSRSNLALRDMVLHKGRSNTNLLEDALNAQHDRHTDMTEHHALRPKRGDVEQGLEHSDQLDAQRRKHESNVAEIMAV